MAFEKPTTKTSSFQPLFFSMPGALNPAPNSGDTDAGYRIRTGKGHSYRR